MPGEGIVKIGAEFDKTNVDAGLGSTQELVKSAMQSINTTITEAGAKSKAAWKGLSEEIKSGAIAVNAEALKLAESSRAVAAAQLDVRRAVTLTKDATIPAAQSMAALAQAQTRLAQVQAENAIAAKAEASAVAAAAEEAGLSSNFIVAGFQRAGLQVREALTSVQEKLLQVAETGQLSAQGVSGGFAALGPLLGAGIAAGFATHYIDELAKMNVELEHLATESGIGITNLAGLQEIAKEMGSEWEPIATGLTRMSKNLNDSIAPSKQLTEALAGVNLKVADLQGMSPEDKLQKIAIAFAGTTDSANRTAAAYALFGRGGVALIPILTEQGAQLETNIKREGALTGITNESAAAARRWTQDIARLSAQFRSVMIPVMEHAEDVIRGIVGTFDFAAFVLVSGFELIGAAVVSIYAPIYRLGALLKDVFTGNWSAIKADAEKESSAFADTWKAGIREIESNWKVVAHDFTYSTPIPKEIEGGFGTGESIDNPAALRDDERELNELKLKHRLSIAEEKDFWQKKLAAARKGSDEYYGIEAKLAELTQHKGATESPKKDLSADEDELTHLLATHKLEIADEESFWRKKLALNKGGFAEYEEILKKINLARQARGGPQTENLELTLSGSDAAAIVKEKQDAAKAMIEADREAAEEKMRIAAEDYRDVETNSAFEVQMGRLTAQQRIEVLRQAALREQTIRQEQSRFIQALDMGDVRRYAQDLRQEEQATRQWARQVAQLNQQAALDSAKSWKQSFDRMSEDFSRNIAMWATGQESLARSWARTLEGMTQAVIQNLLKQAIAYATNAATQNAIDERQKLKDAAAAARGAYKALVGIPIVGPVLAPIGAAAAFAAVEAFEMGGIVGGRGAVPILAHAGERVLSSSQTNNFERLVNQTTSSSKSSSTVNHTTNMHLNGYDRAGLKAALRSHASDIHEIVREGYRSGALTA